jgi:uncharacterized membrane protein YbaN (DUF454 family)
MLARWSQRKAAPAKVAAVEVAVAAVEVAVAAVEVAVAAVVVVVVAAAQLKATMINFRNASRMPLQVDLQPNHK